MQLNKLKTQREAQHRIIEITLEKFEEENLQKSTRRKLLQILEGKLDTVRTLNEKIANHADVEDLVTELVESEQYIIDLELKLDGLRETQSVSTVQSNENQNSGNDPTSNQTLGSSHVSLNTTSSFHKLPKITLPHFHGNIVEWQTFWDCFESSVHLNTALSDVQKFSYLRSLLHSEAESCIAGFQLTNANYTKAVDLLIERFGQQHKIKDAYMKSLLILPSPDNNTVSLQNFNDKLETFIRGLESLGQCQDSYGDLLVPIIRDKLPNDVKRNMARDHGNREWTLHELRESIRKEVNILQEGEIAETTETHLPTASFFAGSKTALKKTKTKVKSTVEHARSVGPRKLTCPFCKGQHAPTDCTNVINVDEICKYIQIILHMYNSQSADNAKTTNREQARICLRRVARPRGAARTRLV